MSNRIQTLIDKADDGDMTAHRTLVELRWASTETDPRVLQAQGYEHPIHLSDHSERLLHQYLSTH